MNLKYKSCTLVFLLLTILFSSTHAATTSILVTSEAYVLDTVLWPYNPSVNFYYISICWEKFSQSTAAERKLVHDAIKSSWEKYSLVRFTPVQGECLPYSGSVRITVDNVNPPRAALGTQGNGKVGVMRLNFRLNTPVQATSDSGYPLSAKKTLLARCQAETPGSTLSTCIQSTAIHEFGHILGLAHEQNRPTLYRDNIPPRGLCLLRDDDDPNIIPQGSFATYGNTLFTDYDPDSMMNYCRKPYFGRRDLSNLDKLAMRVYYGQMPSFDIRARILRIPRIVRYDGAVLTGSFNLLPDGRFEQAASFVTTTTPSMVNTTLSATGVLTIPELKYINPAGHVNQVLKATLSKTTTPGVYAKSWVRIQPTQFSPVPF